MIFIILLATNERLEANSLPDKTEGNAMIQENEGHIPDHNSEVPRNIAIETE